MPSVSRLFTSGLPNSALAAAWKSTCSGCGFMVSVEKKTLSASVIVRPGLVMEGVPDLQLLEILTGHRRLPGAATPPGAAGPRWYISTCPPSAASPSRATAHDARGPDGTSSGWVTLSVPRGFTSDRAAWNRCLRVRRRLLGSPSDGGVAVGGLHKRGRSTASSLTTPWPHDTLARRDDASLSGRGARHGLVVARGCPQRRASPARDRDRARRSARADRGDHATDRAGPVARGAVRPARPAASCPPRVGRRPRRLRSGCAPRPRAGRGRISPGRGAARRRTADRRPRRPRSISRAATRSRGGARRARSGPSQSRGAPGGQPGLLAEPSLFCRSHGRSTTSSAPTRWPAPATPTWTTRCAGSTRASTGWDRW